MRSRQIFHRQVGRSFRIVAAAVAAALLATAAWAAQDAQAILASSDRIRNPDKPFSVMTTLIEYRNGSQTDSMTLQVYSKEDPRNGQFRSLMRFVAPARDTNKLMLKNGNDLWFFDPAGSASVRISPQQRLLGQAANGDVVTVNLSKDYQASLEADEEIQDGDRKSRRCHKLALTAVASDVTYHRIELWVDAETNRPVKSKYYTQSSRLLKTAFYRRFQPELGAERPTEVVIIDGLDTRWVTVLRLSEYVRRDLPDAWLQPDYLPRFSPE